MSCKPAAQRSFPTIAEAVANYHDELRQSSQSILKAGTTRFISQVALAENCSQLFFGDRLELTVTLVNLPDFPIGLDVSMRNNEGRLVTYFSTDPFDGVVIPKTQSVTVKFALDYFCFPPGRYDIGVAVSDPGVKLLEEVPAAAQIEVHSKSAGWQVVLRGRLRRVIPAASMGNSIA